MLKQRPFFKTDVYLLGSFWWEFFSYHGKFLPYRRTEDQGAKWDPGVDDPLISLDRSTPGAAQNVQKPINFEAKGIYLNFAVER